MNQTNPNQQRIYLIGFMGAGKTTVGRLLAGLLGYQFTDLDAQIEETEGMSITEIFDQKGEAYFREIEAQCLRQTQEHTNIIVATGGGTPCYGHNMKWMNEQGVTIFLHVSPHILAKRLRRAMLHRPLVAGFENKHKLLTYIENKLLERQYYYAQSQITTYCRKKEVFGVANDLKQLLQQG